MQLSEIIEKLNDQADLYTPLPSAFRTRRQSREDSAVEKVLRFIVRILLILDSDASIDDKIEQIIASANFLR